MDQERKKVLNDALDKLETIGFFAAIGIHFAASTPRLREELGDYVKGTPWERFSSTDQCFRMVHQLAINLWHNLEGIVTYVGPKIGEEKEQQESKLATDIPSYVQTMVEEMLHRKTPGETILSAVEEKQVALTDAQNKIETIGFFAAIGIHFAESTPLLSEELGDYVKGTPWERFSSTDQCFKLVHQLAAEIWHNLEGIFPVVEPKIEEKIEPTQEIIEPKESKLVTEIPSYLQPITEEISRLKSIGESIVSLSGDEKQGSILNHERIKSLGEMIINEANTINENLLEKRWKIYKEIPGGEGTGTRMGKSLELIGEEMNCIKAFGASLVAMGMAFHDGFKLNPRQIGTMGQMIVDLADKVTENLTQTDTLPPPPWVEGQGCRT